MGAISSCCKVVGMLKTNYSVLRILYEQWNWAALIKLVALSIYKIILKEAQIKNWRSDILKFHSCTKSAILKLDIHLGLIWEEIHKK